MAKSERNGKRKSRSNFQTRIPDLGYYFIVTDTNETEANYLYGLRDSLPKELQGRIVIKVTKAKTTELVKVCREQASLEPQFSQPWIVLDRDKVVPFDKIILDAKLNGINAGWSNPCIEIWFDTYFGKMHSYQNSVKCCHGFANTFEKITRQEYQKANKQIYNILNRYGNEKEAIKIAENRYVQFLKNNYKHPSEMLPCTTLHHLVGEIKNKAERNT